MIDVSATSGEHEWQALGRTDSTHREMCVGCGRVVQVGVLRVPGPASRLKCQFWIQDRDGAAMCRLTVGHTGAHEVERVGDHMLVPKRDATREGNAPTG